MTVGAVTMAGGSRFAGAVCEPADQDRLKLSACGCGRGGLSISTRPSLGGVMPPGK
jgi:hypothetical protein